MTRISLTSTPQVFSEFRGMRIKIEIQKSIASYFFENETNIYNFNSKIFLQVRVEENVKMRTKFSCRTALNQIFTECSRSLLTLTHVPPDSPLCSVFQYAQGCQKNTAQGFSTFELEICDCALLLRSFFNSPRIFTPIQPSKRIHFRFPHKFK